MEAQLALPEVALQSGNELTAKDATEHLDGKEERIAWADPMGAIERQSAGGHDAMHVRVKFEFLIPGVEHTEEADSAPRCLGSRATARRVAALVCSKRWYRIFLFCKASGASS